MASREAASSVFDGDGRIVADLPCRICGYNLRTLSRGDACPECGASFEEAVHGNRLRFADKKWIRRLEWGCNLTGIGVLLTGLACGIGRRFGPPAASEPPGSPPEIIVDWIIPWLVLLATVSGVWLFTSPEPKPRNSTLAETVRRVCRSLTLIMLLAFSMLLVAENVGELRSAYVLTIAGRGVELLMWLGVVIYAVTIARRMDDREVRRELRVVFVLLLLGLGGGIYVTAAQVDPYDVTRVHVGIGLLTTLVPIFLFVSAIYLIMHMSRALRALRRAA